MGVLIAVVIAVVLIIFGVIASKGKSQSETSAPVQTMPVKENLEDQTVQRCFSRYLDMVGALRRDYPNGSLLGGYVMISRQENGLYEFKSKYDHNTINSVMRQIFEKYGYLNYYGLRLDDSFGFYYEVKDIKPDSAAEEYLSEKTIIQMLQDRFSDLSVENPQTFTKAQGAIVGFRFNS